MSINPEALAAFVTAPDANAIMEGLQRLSPEVRQSWVSHLALIAPPPVALPPPMAREDGLTGETVETRIVERRLMGETISQIRDAEGVTWRAVQDALRAAQNQGVNLTIHDPPKPNAKPKKEAQPEAVKILRRKHPETILNEIVALRMRGIGPSDIATRLKQDHQYDITQPTLWRLLAKEAQKRSLTYPRLGQPTEPVSEASGQLVQLDELRQQAQA